MKLTRKQIDALHGHLVELTTIHGETLTVEIIGNDGRWSFWYWQGERKGLMARDDVVAIRTLTARPDYKSHADLGGATYPI